MYEEWMYDYILDDDFPKCDFCSKRVSPKKDYIEHNDKVICSDCLELCLEITKDDFYYPPKRQTKAAYSREVYFCDFCGRSAVEAHRMVAREDSLICSGCVGACVNAIKNKTTFEEEQEKLLAKSVEIEQIKKNTYYDFNLLYKEK